MKTKIISLLEVLVWEIRVSLTLTLHRLRSSIKNTARNRSVQKVLSSIIAQRVKGNLYPLQISNRMKCFIINLNKNNKSQSKLTAHYKISVWFLKIKMILSHLCLDLILETTFRNNKNKISLDKRMMMMILRLTMMMTINLFPQSKILPTTTKKLDQEKNFNSHLTKNWMKTLKHKTIKITWLSNWQGDKI